MKKYLSILLAALMVLASLAVGVTAAPEEGNPGATPVIPDPAPNPSVYDLSEDQIDCQGLYYTLDHESKTAIVGKNTYSDSASSGYDYSISNRDSIVIPSIVRFADEEYNVVAVGRNAFDGVQMLVEVVISEGVTSIGEFAFAGSSVQRVSMASTTEIDGFAFWGCDKLADLDLGDSLETIGGGAFWKCSLLYVATLPKTVKTVMTKAFADSGVGQIYFLGENVPAIGAEAIPEDAMILAPAAALDGFAAAGYTATENLNAQIVTSTVYSEAGSCAVVPVSLAGFKGGELALSSINIVIADGLADKVSIFALDSGIVDAEDITITETGVTLANVKNENGSIVLIVIDVAKDAAPGRYDIKATANGFDSCTGAVIICSHENEMKLIAKGQTCTEGGVNNIVCMDCGKILGTEPTEPTAHDYEDFVINPTCTVGGYTRHICRNCGHKYADAEVDATGHDFDSGDAIIIPTLKKEGVVVYTCRTCSYNERKNVKFGDNDCDGEVSVGDAIFILKNVADWNLEGTAYNPSLADVDGDGSVTVGDAIMVLKIVAGWDLTK